MARTGATWATAMASMPSHMTGATAGGGEQVGGQRRERDLLEVQRHERRGGERRGDRDRRRVGDRAGHAPAQRLPQARRERQQPDDRGERQLPAGLARGQGVQGQRRRRGERERVPARRRPPGQRGHEPRDAHDPGALDRRAAARERHVDGDEQRGDREPRPQRDVEHRAQREHQRAQQQHVLPADGQEVREAGALERGLDLLADRLVLAEDHAAQQRRLGRRQSRAEPARRPLARRVERARQPAAGRPGGRPLRDLDGGMRAPPAWNASATRAARPCRARRTSAPTCSAGRHAPVRGAHDGDLARDRHARR